jgi:hypothetical protein
VINVKFNILKTKFAEIEAKLEEETDPFEQEKLVGIYMYYAGLIWINSQRRP